MTQELLDRSNSRVPLQKGDRLLWLYSESDNKFGETIEVIKAVGDKVDYFFPDRPTWRTCLSPAYMVLPRKAYSLEEISQIRDRESRNRRWTRNFLAICIVLVCIAQWRVLSEIRQTINQKAHEERGLTVD